MSLPIEEEDVYWRWSIIAQQCDAGNLQPELVLAEYVGLPFLDFHTRMVHSPHHVGEHAAGLSHVGVYGRSRSCISIHTAFIDAAVTAPSRGMQPDRPGPRARSAAPGTRGVRHSVTLWHLLFPSGFNAGSEGRHTVGQSCQGDTVVTLCQWDWNIGYRYP